MEGSLLEKMPQVEDNLIFFLVVSCVQPLVENLTVDLFFFFYSFGTFYTNKCIINGDRIVLNMWYRKVSKYRYFWRPQCTGLENSFDVCLKGKALLFLMMTFFDIYQKIPTFSMMSRAKYLLFTWILWLCTLLLAAIVLH